MPNFGASKSGVQGGERIRYWSEAEDNFKVHHYAESTKCIGSCLHVAQDMQDITGPSVTKFQVCFKK